MKQGYLMGRQRNRGDAKTDVKKKLTKKQVEAIIVKGIRDFRTSMLSDDKKVRIKAFDLVMPDKKLMRTLFGDDAKFFDPLLEKGLADMRSKTYRFKKEFESSGAIKKLKLNNLRDPSPSGLYGEVLKVIPGKTPVYQAVATYETRGGISSGHLVIGGRYRFVRGLDAMNDYIQKEKRKKAK
jgi:hypothetical protein